MTASVPEHTTSGGNSLGERREIQYCISAEKYFVLSSGAGNGYLSEPVLTIHTYEVNSKSN
jgi:hypothetical protein